MFLWILLAFLFVLYNFGFSYKLVLKMDGQMVLLVVFYQFMLCLFYNQVSST